MLPKANDQTKEICQIFHKKKIQKVLIKMTDVFLNWVNFAKHTFSTLAPTNLEPKRIDQGVKS